MSAFGRTSPFRADDAKVWNRRIFLVAASSGEGLLTERKTVAHLWRRELAFMPPSRHSLTVARVVKVDWPALTLRRDDGAIKNGI